MCTEVIEGAASPGHGEAETLFGAHASCGVLGALVESHDDISAESDLNVDGVFGGEKVRAPVEVRAELDAIVGDFAKRAEREDLETARISKYGARPTHEFMQSAHAADELVTGAQI